DDSIALTLKTVPHRYRRDGGVRHQGRDAERGDHPRPLLAHHVVLRLDGVQAPDPGRKHAAGAQRVIWQLIRPPGLPDRLVRGDHSQLCEAVEAADLLDRKELGGLEVTADAGAVLDPADPRGPALVERIGADAQRRDRADPGDHNPRLHAFSYARLTIRSVASPTVFSSFM